MKTISTNIPNWIYFKVYGGPKTLEKWLVEGCYPEISNMMCEGSLDQWFFIRYEDPEPHLRIRIQRAHDVTASRVIENIRTTANPFIGDHRLWKFDVLPYRPEFKVYGHINMHLFENLFYMDSEGVMEVLATSASSDLQARWLISIASVDDLVGIFYPLWSDKAIYYREVSERYRREFEHNQEKKVIMDRKFREMRKDMEFFLLNPGSHPLNELIFQRNLALADEMRNIRINRGWWKDRKEVLIRLIHLRFNRLFPDNQRLLEWVTLELLFRYYRSAMAHQKPNLPLHEKNPVSTPVRCE